MLFNFDYFDVYPKDPFIRKKYFTNFILFFLFLTTFVYVWDSPINHKIDMKSWRVFLIFIFTIFNFILFYSSFVIISIFSLIFSITTNTITVEEAFFGYQHQVIWLVFSSFIIARASLKTGLGKRLSYLLLFMCGKTVLGISYAFIIIEIILSLFITSNTARGGGIVYPIVQSVISYYAEKLPKEESISLRSYLLKLCFYSNTITSALFLTGLTGNIVAVGLAEKFGITITWLTWAKFTILPGLVNLMFLPFILKFFHSIDLFKTCDLSLIIHKNFQEIGKITFLEKKIIIIFFFIILFLFFGKFFNITAAISILIGVMLLLITRILDWRDIKNEQSAFNTIIWLGYLISLTSLLADSFIIQYIKENISIIFEYYNHKLAIFIIFLIYFILHYFTASTLAHFMTFYSPFLTITIGSIVPSTFLAIFLCVLSNLSGALTHYSTGTAPLYFNAGQFTLKDWWKSGAIISISNLAIWILVGCLWWRLLKFI